jgi:hypothetical protein
MGPLLARMELSAPADLRRLFVRSVAFVAAAMTAGSTAQVRIATHSTRATKRATKRASLFARGDEGSRILS